MQDERIRNDGLLMLHVGIYILEKDTGDVGYGRFGEFGPLLCLPHPVDTAMYGLAKFGDPVESPTIMVV